jgi:hypothetical protein
MRDDKNISSFHKLVHNLFSTMVLSFPFNQVMAPSAEFALGQDQHTFVLVLDSRDDPLSSVVDVIVP